MLILEGVYSNKPQIRQGEKTCSAFYLQSWTPQWFARLFFPGFGQQVNNRRKYGWKMEKQILGVESLYFLNSLY